MESIYQTQQFFMIVGDGAVVVATLGFCIMMIITLIKGYKLKKLFAFAPFICLILLAVFIESFFPFMGSRPTVLQSIFKTAIFLGSFASTFYFLSISKSKLATKTKSKQVDTNSKFDNL